MSSPRRSSAPCPVRFAESASSQAFPTSTAQLGGRERKGMVPGRRRSLHRKLAKLPETCVKGVKTAFRSGCRSVVLVHEAAETIAAADVAAGRLFDLGRFGRLKRESAVRAFAVVMPNVDAKDVFEVAAADDQEPIERFGSDGADESLGVRV